MGKQTSLFLCSVLLVFSCAAQNETPEKIALNQIGFYPSSHKLAVVEGGSAKEFYVTEKGKSERVLTGKLSEPRKSQFSDKRTQIADLSQLTKEGQYVLVVPGVGSSYDFEVRRHVHEDASKAAIKSYYFQRFSTALPEEYAGRWSRPASHPDNKVFIHASAASEKRPEGTTISSPKGWIDAGDYNKYIVNSGITTSTLLSAYEDFPAYYDQLALNIPESGNSLPDILDEVLWNLRWMLTMQDPNDGGVYHKCTNAKFDPMVMPHKAVTPRYVVQKSTPAALNFAAVMSQAAVVFSKFEKEVPGLSDSCLTAAKAGWEWATRNPEVYYRQEKMNEMYDPDVATGAYGDNNVKDEFLWAAAALYRATGSDTYLDNIDFLSDANTPVPGWNQVKMLSYYSLLADTASSEKRNKLVREAKQRVLAKADQLIAGVDNRAYHTVMGESAKDFEWGSNAVVSNQAIVLIKAYQLTKDKKYLAYAIDNLDYIFGRNATGYSFVTGFGDKTPMHPHHRPSEADGIVEPVPGFVVGGPNPGMQDKCNYPSSVADEAYVDDVCSYASNEVAINWNAPLVYLLGAMEVYFD